MLEAKGDIFKFPVKHNGTEAICVTTNGMIRNDGRAVMGAGVAKAFRDRYVNLDKRLAEHLKKNGNVPGDLCTIEGYHIISFPTKHDWRDDSSIELILESAQHLVEMANSLGLTNVYLPRPGCRNGHLNWDDVKPRLEKCLDNRFIIVTL